MKTNMNRNINTSMKIETIQPCPIAYVRQTGAYGEENIRAMEQLKQWARDSGLMNSKAVIFGIPQDNPQTTAPENCRYDACILLVEDRPAVGDTRHNGHVASGDTVHVAEGDTGQREQAQAGGTVQYGEIAGGTYAVFTVSHTAEAVAQAWIEIFPRFSESRYLPDISRPILERYQAGLVAAHLCEICVPIENQTLTGLDRRRI